MQLDIHWVNHNLVEVEADEVESGLLNQEEAKELAINLISIANELLQVEGKKN